MVESKNHVEQREDKEINGSRTSAEVAPEKQQRKRGRIMTLIITWWWLLLIIFCCGVLIVTLPLVLVGFPRIVQSKLNSASVTVEGIRITQPTPNSVWMEMNSTIHSNGGISATIEGFNASLYLEDKPGQPVFGYLQMPETTAQKTVIVNVSQIMNIYDMQAYTDFNTWFLLNESFRLTLNGDTYVHVKGLKKSKANFRKVVTLKGLNGFKGLNVTDFTVSITPDALGDDFNGHASIPNPSVLTVQIGNAIFDNQLNDSTIGQLYIDDMTLYPGPNVVPIRANISQVQVITAVQSPAYCKTGIVPFELVGSSVNYNGSEIAYYGNSFKQSTQVVSLDIGSALKKTLGSALGCANTTSS